MTSAISDASAAVAAATANSNAASQSSADESSLIGTTDQFLTILLAQLKHQDPLEPMKGTEFIDSITRLSSVEQNINQNKHLEKITSLLSGEQENFGSPVSYLDKAVEVSSADFNLINGEGSFFYNLAEVPESVSLLIRDQDGNLVLTAEGSTNEGRNTITWDGSDSSGNYLDDGVYTVEIAAVTDDAEASYAIESFTSGIVTEAGFDDSGEMSIVIGNGFETTLDKVTKIRSISEQTAANDTGSESDDT